jgi:hypothetical protein
MLMVMEYCSSNLNIWEVKRVQKMIEASRSATHVRSKAFGELKILDKTTIGNLESAFIASGLI